MKNTSSKFELTIETGDLASEIFILDSQFHRIHNAVGKKSIFQLESGMYIVKVQTCNQSIEKSIVLNSDKTIKFELIPIQSPIPNFNNKMVGLDSMRNVEYNQQDLKLGVGSRLYVSIKNDFLYNEDNFSANIEPNIGLTLRNFKNEILFEFTNTQLALDVEITPESYLLCVENNEGKLFKLTIITSLGWQTQVFLRLREFGYKRIILKPDLINCSVFMKHESRYNLNNTSEFYDDRLTEQIRQGLLHGRNVLSEEVLNKLLSEKFENPMLGIYAAHLLLLDESKNSNIVSIIIKNLRKMLGNQHPDVEAIALKVGIKSNFKFEKFPMLAKSWNFVLYAYRKNPKIIPNNSIAYKNSGNFWNTDFWLIWGNEDISHLKSSSLNLIKGIIPNVSPISDNNSKIDFLDILNYPLIKEKLIKKNLNKIPKAKKWLDSILNKVDMNRVEEFSKNLGIPSSKMEKILNKINFEEIKNQLIDFNAQSSAEFNDDPQKGRWGGKPKNNSRELSAEVSESKILGLYHVKIFVKSTNKKKPLFGLVKFHLHNTFLNPNPVVLVENGIAELELNGVWGSFTIGAEIENEETMLELDLSDLPDVSEAFKKS